MKPVTVQWGGRVGSRERRQASVIEEVPLGFMRRMLMGRVEEPVTERRGDSAIVKLRMNEFK